MIPIDSRKGLEVYDLSHYPAFAERRLRTHDPESVTIGFEQLAQALIEAPETLLQRLVELAVDLCGAESAGLSIEHPDRDEENYFEWVATAGQYKEFMNTLLPRYPSACGMALERGGPQLFRVSELFFESMDVHWAAVTDGLLLPWHSGETRGTIWIMAHGRSEAFDQMDLKLMQVLAKFAANGWEQKEEQKAQLKAWALAAATAMTSGVASKMDGPMKAVSDRMLMAAASQDADAAKELAEDLRASIEELRRLLMEVGGGENNSRIQ